MATLARPVPAEIRASAVRTASAGAAAAARSPAPAASGAASARAPATPGGPPLVRTAKPVTEAKASAPRAPAALSAGAPPSGERKPTERRPTTATRTATSKESKDSKESEASKEGKESKESKEGQEGIEATRRVVAAFLFNPFLLGWVDTHLRAAAAHSPGLLRFARDKFRPRVAKFSAAPYTHVSVALLLDQFVRELRPLQARVKAHDATLIDDLIGGRVASKFLDCMMVTQACEVFDGDQLREMWRHLGGLYLLAQLTFAFPARLQGHVANVFYRETAKLSTESLARVQQDQNGPEVKALKRVAGSLVELDAAEVQAAIELVWEFCMAEDSPLWFWVPETGRPILEAFMGSMRTERGKDVVLQQLLPWMTALQQKAGLPEDQKLSLDMFAGPAAAAAARGQQQQQQQLSLQQRRELIERLIDVFISLAVTHADTLRAAAANPLDAGLQLLQMPQVQTVVEQLGLSGLDALTGRSAQERARAEADRVRDEALFGSIHRQLAAPAPSALDDEDDLDDGY